MKRGLDNGWTGGQYSLFRQIFGAYLAVHFAQLLPWGAELFSNRGMLAQATHSPLLRLFPNVLAVYDGPWFVTLLLSTAVLLALLLACGQADRWAALGLWYILACTFGRNPLIANPSLPYVGWLLLAHALLPTAPWGSWAARGRPDAGAHWRMPRAVFGAAWAVMALGYSYSGWAKLVSPSWVDGTALGRVLDNPLARPGWPREALLALPEWMLQWATWGALGLELLYAPLALATRMRPLLWSAMLLMHLGLIALIDFADLSLGMVILHGFTFDPAWVRGERAGGADLLFYDGSCGLCHRAVRFVLSEDRRGDAIRFAPLGGEAFVAEVPGSVRRSLPDSLVVRTADGRFLTRSDCVLYLARRLGGIWRLLAAAGRVVPRPLRDRGYDFIARVRSRLFATPAQACPVLPPDLRERFRL